MLDQNTDRMWYVIGAVLIGAAIIFGMNTLMPNAFASVSDMFGDTIHSVQRGLESYGDNVLNGYVLHPHQAAVYSADYDSDRVVYLESDDTYDGMYLALDDLELKTNTSYLLRYYIQADEGLLFNVGGHMDTPFKDNIFYVDGVRRNINYHLPGRDGSGATIVDGVNVNPPTVFFEGGSTDKHLVEVYIQTTDEWAYTHKEDFDGRIYIQANRGFQDEPVKVRISDLELVEVM